MKEISRKKVIIFTPAFWSDNSEAVTNPKYWSYGNKANYHKSLWAEEDFKGKGYIRIKTPYDKGYIVVANEKLE